MKTLTDLVADIERLQESDIQSWIEAAWLHPVIEGGSYFFSAAEEARLRLIVEIRYDLGVEAETMPLVLSLLDQLYDTRRQLRALSHAVTTQPEEVRAAILALLQEMEG